MSEKEKPESKPNIDKNPHKPERVVLTMCEHIKNAEYKTIYEVDENCQKRVDWLKGKYFCFKADCDECKMKNEGKKTE